jgi:CBS domain-containing protein
MRARELAEPFPTVGVDDDALGAARLLAERRLPGLIVVDADGAPSTVLPGSQVLRFALPAYVQDDPSLARVYDERTADHLCDRLTGGTVRDLLPREPIELPVVEPDDTVMELAAIMAQLHSPLVAVVDDGRLIGAVTVAHLLERVLPD